MSTNKIIKQWSLPYPECKKEKIRPKQFQIIEFNNGEKIFVKKDSLHIAIENEVKNLKFLKDVKFVPALLWQETNAIHIKYIKGCLLSDKIKELSFYECLNAFFQIIYLVNMIHKKGIIHADIRPWNFIYNSNKQVFLFDFEYAYKKNKKYNKKTIQYLQKHHGKYLKSIMEEWRDVFNSIFILCCKSKSWVIREIFAKVNLFFYFVLHIYSIRRFF
jgi:tRNA A-37 threonylcarbamoyl transferase component Bud32